MAVIPSSHCPGLLFDQLLHIGKNVDGCQRSLREVKIRIPEKHVGGGSIGYNAEAEQMTRDSERFEGSLS